MAYFVANQQNPICSPYGTFHPGTPFVKPPELPQELFQAWIKNGLLVMDKAGPDVEEIPTTSDFLSDMTRKELMRFIGMNKLHQQAVNPIKPMSSWPDEVIRQAIRDFAPDFETLPRPEPEKEEPVVP